MCLGSSKGRGEGEVPLAHSLSFWLSGQAVLADSYGLQGCGARSQLRLGGPPVVSQHHGERPSPAGTPARGTRRGWGRPSHRWPGAAGPCPGRPQSAWSSSRLSFRYGALRASAGLAAVPGAGCWDPGTEDSPGVQLPHAWGGPRVQRPGSWLGKRSPCRAGYMGQGPWETRWVSSHPSTLVAEVPAVAPVQGSGL